MLSPDCLIFLFYGQTLTNTSWYGTHPMIYNLLIIPAGLCPLANCIWVFLETQVLGTYITDSRLLGAFKNICRLQVSVHVVVLGMADERDTSQGLKRSRLVGLRPMGGYHLVRWSLPCQAVLEAFGMWRSWPRRQDWQASVVGSARPPCVLNAVNV